MIRVVPGKNNKRQQREMDKVMCENSAKTSEALLEIHVNYQKTTQTLRLQLSHQSNPVYITCCQIQDPI